jgi:DNA-binding LacI/PurR family transcriptional regulator
MDTLTVFSITEQVAGHLRRELLTACWSETMPGRNWLAEELGVSRKVVQGALDLLEKEGLLTSQGPGRKRLITLPPDVKSSTSLRIAILDYEPQGQTDGNTIELQHMLAEKGHTPFFTEKSLIELDMNVKRVAQIVAKTKADAWIICSGSREVLEWFAQRETPAFAKFGRRRQLPIAGVGPDHVAACRAAVRRLLALGHKRIILLVREGRRSGGAGSPERAIFEEMTAHGLPAGPYNLPHWEDTYEGFQRVLEELFRVTRPTALIIDEPFLFHAAKEHLAQRGVLAPSHVSLICADPDPTFAWCKPSVAHIRWDHRPVARRVVRWAANVASGKNDRQQTLTKAEFIEGGTIGPAPSN